MYIVQLFIFFSARSKQESPLWSPPSIGNVKSVYTLESSVINVGRGRWKESIIVQRRAQASKTAVTVRRDPMLILNVLVKAAT